MKIDEKTGLPELPEGLFWRVSAHWIEIRVNLPDSEWMEVIPYLMDGEIESRRVEVPRKNKLFSGERNKVEKVEYRLVNRSAWVFEKRYGKWGEKLESFGIGWQDRLEEPDPVTPENVLERCIEVKREFDDWKRTQEIYGDYPPKKLGA